jgi:hypothetical protein
MAKAKEVVVSHPTKDRDINPQHTLACILEDSGGGFEEATRDSYAIPFLSILQDLSPQVKSKMSGYIKGAEPGMIYNSVSNRLYPAGVRVIPCHFSPTLIEWIPRDQGGGFVKAHPANSPLLQQAVREGSRNVLPNGHELQMTAQHFVLVLDDKGKEAPEGALITMKSTQLKYSRRWMSQMRAAVVEVQGKLVQPPMWAWSYQLTADEEANDEGSWWSWQVGDRMQVLDLAIYQQAKAFAQSMKSGTVKVNYEDLQTHSDTGDAPGDLDNEINA